VNVRKNRSNRLALLALACAAASAHAAISFEPAKNYPNLGLMLPRLANAKATPLPMPQAYPVVLVGDETLDREDRFDPFELWYNSQCCARWRDASGNRLVIGRMTHHLPDFADEQVSRARFSAAADDDGNAVDPKSADQVNEWVATFADSPVYEPEPLKLNGAALDDVLYYPCDSAAELIYAFRPRRVGNAKSFDWFCVTLQAPGEADRAALRALFEEQFLGRLALPSRASKNEGVEAEEVQASRKGEAPLDQPGHPVRAEARKSVENYDDWWFAETEGYIILSDVHTEVGKSVIRDLQATLPALRQACLQLVPPLTHETDVALLRLFQTRDDYVRYVGEERAWSGGMWMPGRRELVLFQQGSKDDMMRTIRHEAFHQYLSHAYCMLSAAAWLNEGHACLFENARVDRKGKVTFEEDPERGPLLIENIDTAVTLLPFLLRATYDEFYDGTPAGRKLKYAMAWGLAYYFQKGAPLERNTPFKAILPNYAAALAQTRNRDEATALTFKDVDMAVFQENFREFWLKRRGSALQYDPLDP